MTYGFVPAIQNKRVLAFVGIPLILCRFKCCSYNCTSILVFYLKHMFLFRSNLRHRLGMVLRTYRETKLCVLSRSSQVLSCKTRRWGRSQARWFTIKILFPQSRSNPHVRSNAYHNNVISLSNPPLISHMCRRGSQLPLTGA